MGEGGKGKRPGGNYRKREKMMSRVCQLPTSIIYVQADEKEYWCNVCTDCERVSDILIPPLCIPTNHLSTPSSYNSSSAIFIRVTCRVNPSAASTFFLHPPPLFCFSLSFSLALPVPFARRRSFSSLCLSSRYSLLSATPPYRSLGALPSF